jgi:AcrR family transcriptional regulator
MAGPASVPRTSTPLSPRALEIVGAARQLLETEGPEGLTMRRLGETLGIRAPSIYKHLPGKHAVEVALIENALAEMGKALHRSVEASSSADAIPSLLSVYRAYGVAHPNLYRLCTSGQLPRREIAAGLEEWAGEPFFLVTADHFLAQALWSYAHGMVILELDQRYPDGSELARTWRAGSEAFAEACRVASRIGRTEHAARSHDRP